MSEEDIKVYFVDLYTVLEYHIDVRVQIVRLFGFSYLST